MNRGQKHRGLRPPARLDIRRGKWKCVLWKLRKSLFFPGIYGDLPIALRENITMGYTFAPQLRPSRHSV